MCGRYLLHSPIAEIAHHFGVSGPTPNLAPNYNLAPTQQGLVVRRHPESGERRLDVLQWGLVPYWAKDAKGGARLINAAEVALITLLEVVLGPLWVWIAFSETPDTATLVGGLVVLVAVIVQVSGEVRMPVRLSATEAAPPPP